MREPFKDIVKVFINGQFLCYTKKLNLQATEQEGVSELYIERQLMAYDKKLMESYHGQACTVCQTSVGTHGEHLKTKGAGAPCIKENIMPICNNHHREKEDIGIDGMAEKYSHYRDWLKRNGWYWYAGLWLNDKVNEHINKIEAGWKW